MSSNFPHGFASGVTIRGIPLLQLHPGEVFWVSNSSVLAYGQDVTGSDGNEGSFRKPFSSITHALTQCKADRGDIIMLGVGHNDSLAAGGAGALTFDVSGVAIVGTGVGSNRSAITWTGATDTVVVSAANISFSNISFEAGVAQVATGLDVSAVDGLSFDNCYFTEGAAAGTFNFVDVINLATGADNFSMTRCYMYGRDTKNDSQIIGVAHDKFYLDNCVLFNAVAQDSVDANIAISGNVTNIEVKDTYFYNNVDGATCVVIGGSACGGVFRDCAFGSSDAAGFLIIAGNATGAHFFNCYGSGDDGTYGAPTGGTGIYVDA